MRWQIELVFKRLKSLAQLGHVPKHDRPQFPRLALWKIACHAPSAEIDSHRARYFPLGLGPTLGAKDHVVRRVNSVSHFTRSSKLSNRHLSLQQTLYSWNDIAQALAEGPASDYFN